MKNDFSRNEILVIKASKHHFEGDSFEQVKKIIARKIYGQEVEKTPFECFYRVVREIFLKSRNWSASQWADREAARVIKAFQKPYTYPFDDPTVKQIQDALLYSYIADIAHLVVMDGEKKIIDLDITDDEMNKVVQILN